MSGEDLVDALLGPSLGHSLREQAVVRRFTQRLFEIGREPAYRYMADQRGRILACFDNPLHRAEFVLGGWRAADPDEWGEWAALLKREDLPGMGLSELAAAVAAEMVATAPTLEAPATVYAAGLIPRLAPALREAGSPVPGGHLIPAVEEALAEHEWWGSTEELAQRQFALHELIRAIEAAMSAAAEPLRAMRSADVLAPLDGGWQTDPTVLRGWRRLAHDLTPDAYEQMAGALGIAEATAAEPADEPGSYAEVLATRATLQRLDPDFDGGPTAVAGLLKQIRAVAKWDEHRDLAIEAAAACLALNPSAEQMSALLAIVGDRVPDHATRSVRSWAAAAGKRRTTTLIRRLMSTEVARRWLPLLGEARYEEAPVIQAVKEVLLDKRNSSVEERLGIAESLEALGLRTRHGHDEVVGLIVAVLKPKRPWNDLDVALSLCRCLGPDLPKAATTRVEKALVSYAKRRGREFTPRQNESILGVGVELPERYLSKTARERIGNALVRSKSALLQRLSDAA